MKTSQKKFWETLSEISDTFRLTKVGDRIRQKRTNVCPVCAVARMLLPKAEWKKFGLLEYNAAARAIGLDLFFAYGIARASDDSLKGLFWNKAIYRLRKKLLKTLGLEEK